MKQFDVGDEVLTAGGIVGHIIDIEGDRVTLETSVGASFVVLRPYILRRLDANPPPLDTEEDEHDDDGYDDEYDEYDEEEAGAPEDDEEDQGAPDDSGADGKGRGDGNKRGEGNKRGDGRNRGDDRGPSTTR